MLAWTSTHKIPTRTFTTHILPEAVVYQIKPKFADGTMTLNLTIKNDQDARSLQHDLDLLCEWETRWLMELHPDKCEVISVTRKKHPTLHPYYIHGHQLKHVDHSNRASITVENISQFSQDCLWLTLTGHFQSHKNEKKYNCQSITVGHYGQAATLVANERWENSRLGDRRLH